MEDEQLAELGKHIASQLVENKEFIAAIAQAIMDAPAYPNTIKNGWNLL